MTASLTLNQLDRVLIYAVHPDDETLGAGGLIQQALAANATVRVIFVTDGDNNPWPQRFLERRWHLTAAHRHRWGQRRRREALAALAALGVDPAQVFSLGWPDQGITALLKHGGDGILEHIATETAQWQPTCIVAPALQDQHPDHNAFGVLVDLAVSRLDTANTRPRVLYYLIHGEAFYAPAYSIELSDRELERKRRATACHATQMALSRQRLLRYATRRENYLGTPSFDGFQLPHPVTTASIAPPLLTLQVRMSGLLRRLGKPTLSILAGAAPAPAIFQLDLGARGKADIRDSATHKTVGQADLAGDRETLEVALPLSLFRDAENIYLKLERRGLFFDPAGWRGAALHPQKTPAGVIGVIPCYDVGSFCEQVILQAVRHVDQLIVIDDGSTDSTPQVTTRLAMQLPGQISLVRFSRNQGKGVALMAGFCHALNHFDFQTLVTLDADGQHPPGHIPELVQKIRDGAEMAIGERQLQGMPGRSRVGNELASSAIRWLYPHAPTDTQSGMRAFSRALVEDIAQKISGSRYETEFQILLLALSEHRRIASVPIPTIYIDNNRSSKFRPVADTLRIARTMIHWH